MYPDAARLCDLHGKIILCRKHIHFCRLDDSDKMKHPISPTDQTGLIAHFAGLIAAALRYLKARVTLAGIEAKAAGAHYGIAAAMVAGALFIAVLGYVFLVLTVVFAIASALGGGRAWIAKCREILRAKQRRRNGAGPARPVQVQWSRELHGQQTSRTGSQIQIALAARMKITESLASFKMGEMGFPKQSARTKSYTPSRRRKYLQNDGVVDYPLNRCSLFTFFLA